MSKQLQADDLVIEISTTLRSKSPDWPTTGSSNSSSKWKGTTPKTQYRIIDPAQTDAGYNCVSSLKQIWFWNNESQPQINDRKIGSLDLTRQADCNKQIAESDRENANINNPLRIVSEKWEKQEHTNGEITAKTKDQNHPKKPTR